jgi:hypothetical protein
VSEPGRSEDAEAPPSAYVSHRTRDRLRLKVPERRHDAAYFERLKAQLLGYPGVTAVVVNPLTASALVHYDGRPGALVPAAGDGAARRDLFVLADPDADRPAQRESSLLSSVRQRAAGLDQELRSWSGGSLDLRSAAFLGLASMGVVQLLRGNVAAPAITLLWYAAAVAGGWGDVPLNLQDPRRVTGP